MGAWLSCWTQLSDISRDRYRIQRLIKSLTAQNRVSAWTVCSVPPLLAVFMFMREPEMMAKTMAHPMGHMMFNRCPRPGNRWYLGLPQDYQDPYLGILLWNYLSQLEVSD